VVAWQRSGQSATEFARRRGVSEDQLRRWAWKLGAAAEAAKRSGVGLVRLEVEDAKARTAGGRSGAACREPLWTLTTPRGELRVFEDDGAGLRDVVATLVGTDER
jgi:hypothetical protein